MFYQKVWEPALKRYDVVSLKTKDREEAERLGKELLAALLKGEPQEPKPTVTLGELWERYKTESQSYLQSAATTQKDAKSRAAILLGFFGSECDVSTLTQDDVRACEVKRRAGGLVGRKRRVTVKVSARSVDADLVLLRAMLRWATTVRTPGGKRWLHENPLQGIRNVREQNPRRPVVTWERFVETRAAMQELAAGAKTPEQRRLWTLMELSLVLAQATGRRLSSIRCLRWEDFDFEGSTITWRPEFDKKGKRSVVPMPASLLTEVKSFQKRLRAIAGWVFARESDANQPMDRHLFDKWLAKAEKQAGLPKLQGGLWHPYRRMWATARAHLPLKQVAVAGGWKDTETLLKCYQQPDRESLLVVMSDQTKVHESAVVR